MTILVLGGTGFVGRALAAAMVARAGVADLTVPTRKLAHGQALQVLPGVELVEADVHEDATLARLVAGKSAVVNLIAILHGSAADFERVHVAMPRRLAAACRAAAVRRVVHVSALGVGANAPSMYLRSKAAGEAALRDAALDLTILRPSVMFGAEDQLLNLFAQLQTLMPVLALAGGDAKMQPVWVGDVAQAIVHCLDAGGIQPPEAGGVEAVLAGLRESIPDDDRLLAAAGAVFDGLIVAFEKDGVPR